MKTEVGMLSALASRVFRDTHRRACLTMLLVGLLAALMFVKAR